MKRKKQFMAFSLAVALILGGLPASSLSRVHAEEAQTETSVETPTDESTAPSLEAAETNPVPTETPAEILPDETPAPTVAPTEEPGDVPEGEDPAETNPDPTETPVDPIVDPEAGPIGSVSGGDVDILDELPEGMQILATYSARAAYANGQMESGKVDYFKNAAWEEDAKAGTSHDGLKALGEDGQPKNYGNDAIQIYLTNDVNFKADTNSGKGRVIDGYTYWYGIQFKANGAAGDVKVEDDGSVTAKNAVQITAVKNGSISFVMYKSGNAGENKLIHFQCFEDGQLKEYEGYGTEFTAHKTHTFNLEEGKTYYLWTENVKGQIYDITYTYEKDAEPPVMITREETVNVLEGLNKGTDYGKSGVIEITVSHNMKNPGGKTYIQAYKDDDSSTINGKLELNDDGTVKTKEGLIEVRALEEGCTITFDIKAASGKIVHFYHVEGTGLVEDSLTGVDAADAPYTFDLEKDVTYYFYVAGSKMSLEGLSYTYQEEKVTSDIELVEGVLAFPTAEGGGRLATGGRGGEVYVVTNLNDRGEGSLRYGIETAPESGRIIVFNVGGTIHLESRLTFKNKKNITIAGQTAPGDGITVAGYDTDISDSENIIIRFVRFRVGTANLLSGGDSMDALWGRDNSNFIIDHCTFSWNTDETLSTYRGENGTVQWCLISESLTVSGHSKGRHGYGGIFGGDNTVFQYNLMTNHTSRNPRIGGGTMTDPGTMTKADYDALSAEDKAIVEETRIATLQLSNNVLYNHGYFACYGGGWTYTNYINNYVKPGQGTRDALNDTLLAFGENNKKGGIYYADNILEGNAAVTADNSKGFNLDSSDGFTDLPDTPYTAEAFDHITLDTTDAYINQVLNSAGATYPHRDAIDARVVAQVKTDTGTYINTQDEVGGYPAANCVSDLVDTDGDGIPDDWESAHQLDPNDPDDSRTLCLEDPDDITTYGYAWIEVYFNELVGEYSKPTYVAENPTVSIDLPDNTLLDQGGSIKVTATAASGKGIAKVEFYNGAALVGTDTEAPYEWTYTPDTIGADGTYHISARAYDGDGNKTQSNTSRLHVNSTAGIGEWSQADIGNPEVAGTASLVDGVLTVKGAGKIGASEGSSNKVRPELANAADDDFHFVYQEMTGDIEIVTRFDSYVPVDNHTFQGLMFRSSLEDDAAMAALGFTMVKVDETTIWSAFMVNRAADGEKVQNISETIDSPEAAKKAGIPLIANLPFKEGNTYMGTWLKLARKGDTFAGSVSSDGIVWREIGELTVDLPDTAYVGFAVDANRAGNDLINYGTAKFSHIEVNDSFARITYTVENLEVAGASQLALGKDLAVTLSKVPGYVLPETVEVTIGGRPAAVDVDYTYNLDTGIIQVQNVQEDISITAFGTKRVVLPVEYEVIDEGKLLTITEEAGKLTLTQVAVQGNMQSTNKDTGAQKDASNVSYLLFPEVDEYHRMSMDVTVKSVTPIGKGNENGFYLGAFAADGSGIYTAFAFRGDMVGKGFWYKPGGAAGQYTGDGNPGITTGSNNVYALDTTYQVVFETDGKGGYNGIVTWPGGKITKQFKAGESVIKTGDAVRYGMAIIGATVEISNLKLIDPESNVIYNQNSADYSKVVEAILKASGLNAADYVDFSAVEAAWDAVDLGLDASHQAEVDAMAKAIEDAIAALEKKGTSEVSQTVEVKISMDIPDSVLTDAVKEKTGCSTVEELVKYMQEVGVLGEYTRESFMVMDVDIQVSINGGPYVSATRETMPKDGVDIILPYPEGTNKNDYDFRVSHLITQDWNGQTAGTMEYPAVTKLDEGLKVHVLSASPFGVYWKKVADKNEKVPSDDKKEPAEEASAVGVSVTTAAVKTGDNMNVSAIIWSIVLLAAAAGMGVLVYRKRRENGTKK